MTKIRFALTALTCAFGPYLLAADMMSSQTILGLLDKAIANEIKPEKFEQFINQRLKKVIPELNEQDLNEVLKKYHRLTAKRPELLKNTWGIVGDVERAIAKLDKRDNLINYKNMIKTFGQLQNNYRALPEWHEGQKDPFSGDILKYIEGFKSDVWETKVNALADLAELLEVHNGDYIKRAVKKFAGILARYAHYLSRQDLYKLLSALAAVDRFEEFTSVYMLLNKINNFTIEPFDHRLSEMWQTKIDAFRKNPTIKISPPSKGISPRDQRSEQIKLVSAPKGKDETIKIPMPINTGLGKTANGLANCSTFSPLKRELLLLLARITKSVTLEAGEVLYNEHDDASSFALIIDGELEILLENKKIATLTKGQSVGEMSLFSESSRRSATVTATIKTQLLEITKSSLKKFVADEPALLQIIFKQLVKKANDARIKLQELNFPIDSKLKLIASTQLHNGFVKFINAFLPPEKKQIKKMAAIVANEGDDANFLFYIDSGEFSLMKKDEEKGALTVGDYYDEIAFFIENGKYPYSLQAKAGSIFHQISRKKFESFSNQNPEILWGMAAHIVEIINESNKQLMNTDAYLLQLACKNNDISEAQKAINRLVDINASCPVLSDLATGSKPIHVAAKYGSLNVLDLLLKNKADVNITDDFGNTAAHIAATEGKVEILEKLNSQNAKLDVENHQGKTPPQISTCLSLNNVSDYFSYLRSEIPNDLCGRSNSNDAIRRGKSNDEIGRCNSNDAIGRCNSSPITEVSDDDDDLF